MSLKSADHSPQEKPRRRAVSKRSLATSLRILDAAERLFAERGYDGASVRDIASAAGAQIASISFHHVGKETLFERVVERRATELSQLRLDALSVLKTKDEPLTLEAVLSAFLRPYLERAGAGGPQWLGLCQARRNGLRRHPLAQDLRALLRPHRRSLYRRNRTPVPTCRQVHHRSIVHLLGFSYAVAVDLDLAHRGLVSGPRRPARHGPARRSTGQVLRSRHARSA
jgi:AcrR family transcriptional regulator